MSKFYLSCCSYIPKMVLLLSTLMLFGCSYSALAKPSLGNIIDSFDQSALASTSEANAFPEHLPTDEVATPNSNPSVSSWADPSSRDLPSEALPKPADIDSFTIAESPCQGRTQTNGKLRIREQAGSCKSPYLQRLAPNLSPPVPLLQHATDYGSDYEKQRPAASPQDEVLSEKDRENSLREQNKALPDNDPLKCARPPFFIPVCCLGSLDLADSMAEGQTVFSQVESCVSCKLVSFFPLTRRLEREGFGLQL